MLPPIVPYSESLPRSQKGSWFYGASIATRPTPTMEQQIIFLLALDQTKLAPARRNDSPIAQQQRLAPKQPHSNPSQATLPPLERGLLTTGLTFLATRNQYTEMSRDRKGEVGFDSHSDPQIRPRCANNK